MKSSVDIIISVFLFFSVAVPGFANSPADTTVFPIKNLRIPFEYYENGRVKIQMFAEGARTVRQDVTELLNAKAEMYTEDGEVDAYFFAERCIVHMVINAVLARSSVEISRSGLRISGSAFEWKISAEMFEINKNARVEIDKAGPVQGIGKVVAGDAGQMVITSGRLEVDYYRNLAFFEDNVRVSDPMAEISSEKLTVVFEGTNRVQSATVDGNVSIVRDDVYAECDKAVYLAGMSKVIMTGVHRLKSRDGVSLTGDRITFFMDKDIMTCENGRMVIPDKESKLEL